MENIVNKKEKEELIQTKLWLGHFQFFVQLLVFLKERSLNISVFPDRLIVLRKLENGK